MDYIYRILDKASLISTHNQISSIKAVLESQRIDTCNVDFVNKQITPDLPCHFFLNNSENIYQLNVNSHTEIHGAGQGSSGYHALKNGIIIAQGLSDNCKNYLEKSEILNSLNDSKIIANLFGKNESSWRNYIIFLRKIEILKDFLYNVLFKSLNTKNYKIVQTIDDPNPLRNFQLKLDEGWIQLYPYYEMIDEDENLLMYIKLMPEISSVLAFNNRFALASSTHNSIQCKAILEAFSKVILSKIQNDPNKLIYEALINEAKIKEYFPAFSDIDIKVSSNSFVEEKLKSILTEKSLMTRLQSNEKTDILGQWITISEMNMLLKLASIRQMLDSLKNTYVCNISDSDLKNIHTFQSCVGRNAQLQSLVKKISDEVTNVTGIFNINIDKYFISCVTNKNQNELKVYVADSNNNTNQVNNPIIINLAEYLSKYLYGEVSTNISAKEKIDSFMTITSPEDITFDLKNDYIGIIPEEINQTIDYLNNTDKYIKSGAELSHCMILSGPPGTGKTSLVQGIAKATNRLLIQCSAGSLITKWQGSGAESITKLFDIANQMKQSTIIFIDEIDTVTSDNGQNNSTGEQRSALVTLMTQLDALNKHKSNEIKVFVICATNHYYNMAEALQSRFASKRVEIPLPNEIERGCIFSSILKKRGYTIDRSLLNHLVSKTNGFSGRPIFDVVNAAIKTMVKNNSELKIDYFLDPITRITQAMKKRDEKKHEEESNKRRQEWSQNIGMAANVAGMFGSAASVWSTVTR